MPVERSAGAVIFRIARKKKEFLLLHHPPMQNSRVTKSADGHWDFPKGHIEPGEKTEDTVRREVSEETGIAKIELIPGFKETIRYFVNYDGTKRLKFVAFFLARAREKKVVISHEHQGYAWLPYEEAYQKLTYQNAKGVLGKAYHFLLENGL